MKNAKTTIEVRIGNTAYGSIDRVVRERGRCYSYRRSYATINNREYRVFDPTGGAFVDVVELPKDLDRRGYE